MHVNDDDSAGALRAKPVRDPFARAFGSRAEDLDVDFATLPRPVLVTEVLRRCLQRSEPMGGDEEIGSWTLPQRSQALIAVALASGERGLQSRVRCPKTECGEMIELHIELAVFLNHDEIRSFDWSPEPARMLRVALPTGDDLKEWLNRGEAAPRAMARQLVQIVDGCPPADDWQVPEAWIDGLAAELEQRDPLTALELEARCFACGAALSVEFDLETELLKRFAARQSRTLQQIHRLASVYHWSEAEILQLPAWRRNYYLSQLERW
jgi:hypothetical protein